MTDRQSELGYENFDLTPHDEILHRARIGELTPRQAEDEAKCRGLSPLSSSPGPEDFDPRQKSRWSLAMVLAWIVWRDFDEVRHWDNAFREKCWDWKPFNVRLPADAEGSERHVKGWAVEQRGPADGLTFEVWGYIPLTDAHSPQLEGFVTQRAKETLWQALQDEELLAEGISAAGGARKVIPPLEWQDLDFRQGQSPHREEFFYRHERIRTAYPDVSFRRDDAVRIWPSSSEKVGTAKGASRPRRNGTQNDFKELIRWIEGRIAGGQPPPRRIDVETWAGNFGIGVTWARKAHSELPPAMKLQPGEGLRDWNAKRQDS